MRSKTFLSRINTQYRRNSTFVYPVKMEYVSRINISSLKMMVKSGLEKNILKFLHAGKWSFLLQTLGFWILL